MTLTDIRNAISSPASGDGLSQPDLLDGLMIGPCGPEVVPASRSVAPAKDWEALMIGICGLNSGGSFKSENLQPLLESRLRARLGEDGSPEFEVIWKHWDMESGPPICALRASARRISGSGFIGSPTPTTQNASGGAKHDPEKNYHFTLQTAAQYMGVPTPRTPTGGAESAARKKELGRTGAGGGPASSSTDVRGDAHAERDGGRPDEPRRGTQRRDADRRDVSGSQHASRVGWEQRRTESGERSAQPRCGDVCGDIDSGISRLERLTGDGNDGSESGRIDSTAVGYASETGPWDDFYAVICRDIDKRTGLPALRRVGCGVQPLAHGIPARVGSLVAGLELLGVDSKTAGRIIRLARRNRVGRLRGYGNAIVPWLGAQFIRSVMEVLA